MNRCWRACGVWTALIEPATPTVESPVSLTASTHVVPNRGPPLRLCLEEAEYVEHPLVTGPGPRRQVDRTAPERGGASHLHRRHAAGAPDALRKRQRPDAGPCPLHRVDLHRDRHPR